MSWIFYSVIMYLASVFQYLLVHKTQKSGVDNRINTFIFLTPALPFVYVYAQFSHVNLVISFPTLIIFAIAVFFFSYLGNVFSFLGIQYAPNAGYSLVIQKSYAIYTAPVAFFLFRSHLSPQGLLAIIIIILFTAVIMINRTHKKNGNTRRWILYSLIAFVMFGNLALFSEYFQLHGMKPASVLFYIVLFNGLFNGLVLFKDRTKIRFTLPKFTWLTLVAIGLSNGVFNLMMQLAFRAAPNIGYVNVINAASVMAITILSTIFFKDKLTIEKIIGVIGVAVGLVLLITV